MLINGLSWSTLGICLWPTLFNSFIILLENGVESVVVRFVDVAKLCGIDTELGRIINYFG